MEPGFLFGEDCNWWGNQVRLAISSIAPEAPGR